MLIIPKLGLAIEVSKQRLSNGVDILDTGYIFSLPLRDIVGDLPLLTKHPRIKFLVAVDEFGSQWVSLTGGHSDCPWLEG
jgi:hypothetical protein